MLIKVDPSVLRQTKWHEYAIRFFVGGLITAIAGVIAKEFGPVIGGLFLAFPAIFPASATLIEKHEEQEEKQQLGQETDKGKEEAGADAAGSAMGCIGLFVFALTVWRHLSSHGAWIVLVAATLVWLVVTVGIWQVRKPLAV